MGGVFNSMNLGLYTYAHQNPVKLIDPDGKAADDVLVWGIAFAEPSPFGEVLAAGYTAGKYTLLGLGVISLSSDTMLNETIGDEPSETGESDGEEGVEIGDKIKEQLGERGWTEGEVIGIIETEPSGTATDNTGGRNDPATVFGTRDDGHVVVNDKTNEVVQVSDKNNPNWIPDDRIKWNED